MKSAKTIVIMASVVFLAVCLGAYSVERDDAAPAKVVPTTPARVSRTPARPGPVIDEETPRPRPGSRPPSRRPAPSRTTPTRPSARPGAARPTPGRRVRPPEDPHKDTVILVEAFMVQVRLSSLRSLGVPQISEGCKSVSAEHIIKLLKTTDAAVVTAGAKLALTHENKARTESTTRKGRHIGPPEKGRTEYLDVGTSFTAIAEIRKEKVFAELEFEYSDIVKAGKKIVVIPQIVERKWASSVCLKFGEPTLVGATQDEDSATFLIVTANIQE